jgi:hypothetical protein
MSSQDSQDPSYAPGTNDYLDFQTSTLDDPLNSGDKMLVQHVGRRGLKYWGLRKLEPPKFPTLFELARTAPEPEAKKNPPGLFELFLHRDPTHILQDARTQAERYDDQALSLLGELHEGARKWETLSATERGMLDNATVEFFSPAKRVEKSVPSFLAPRPPPAGENTSPPKAEPVEGPVMDAFWWTR